jgi:peptidoglycan/xylan/chitin deacetylase (PgdA/CDA1 family)
MIVRPKRSNHLLASVVCFIVSAVLGVGAVAEWNRLDDTPRAQSDLAVPPVFAPDEQVRFASLVNARSEGVPVLCYHYFRPGFTLGRLVRVLGAVFLNLPTIPDKDFWTTTVPTFEQHMRYLHENGYEAIDLGELADWMDGHGSIPRRSVVITIDDGERSFVDYAVPVLRRYGYRATVFMITGRVGERGWNDLEITDWETLRELEREGVIRVESHTHQMHTKVRSRGRHVPRVLMASRDRMGRVSPFSPLGADLLASRRSIERELGHESRFLAWPFGAGSAEVDSLAQSLGFRGVATLWPYRNAPPRADSLAADPLGRFTITARTSLRAFRSMMDGA